MQPPEFLAMSGGDERFRYTTSGIALEPVYTLVTTKGE